MLYIFDMGGVLLKNIDVTEKIAQYIGVNYDEFMSDLYRYDFPIMDGTLSLRTYYNHLEHLYDVKIESDLFYDYFNPCLNEPIVNAIGKLRKRGDTVVSGTNNCDPHWRYITEKGWDKIFERNYASHIIGISKPSKVFFNYILKHEGFSAENTVFVDDYSENIDGAKSIGIKTIWYNEGFDDSSLEGMLGL